jgi:acetylornithine deacetylase
MEKVQAELARLVAFNTVSHRPTAPMAAYLSERLEGLGFSVEPFQDPDHPERGSLIFRAGPRGTDGLVLSGHMDVVPTEGQPWNSDPFRLTERGGRLYGRGAADMKGFFAATLAALEQVRVSELKRELVLLWTHDEEVGCLGAGKLVDHIRGKALSRGNTEGDFPSACLIGEPTEFRVLRMHPGHVVATVEIRGLAAHSSRPDLGLNAIEDAARVVLAARALARDLEFERADLPEMERPWVAFNTASIQAGSAVNIVPDRALIQFGYRPLPGTDTDEVFHRLRQAIEALCLPCSWDARIERRTPAMLTPGDTPLQPILMAHSHDDQCGACSFATDGGQLARLGMQCLVFGPGSIEVAHKADEYIEGRALVRAVDVVEDIIRRRCVH